AGVSGNATLNSYDVTPIATPLGGGVEVKEPPSPISTPNAGVTLSAAAYSIINNLPSGTVETRVRIPQAAGSGRYNYFTIKQHNGSNSEFSFVLRPAANGSNEEQLWHPSNNAPECAADFMLDPSAWYLMGVAWDPSGDRLYINGQRVATCASSNPVPNDPSPTCLSVAGACGDADPSEAGITDVDEIRVLNHALTDADMAADAAGGGGGAPFAARLSVDGGVSFSNLTGVSLPAGTADGDTTQRALSVAGLTLRPSTGPADDTNIVEFTAQDLAGNVSTVRRSVLVDLNPGFSPLQSAPADAALSSRAAVAFSWSLDPRVPAASIASWQFEVASDSA
ncbi:MAG: hypothetical protein KGL53_07130, partial [Elusimicrobia bacterium]|nr:hypothetical protein [Elusimicrobiota bacterium]